MKKLKDMKTLAGQMETISISELRHNPGEVFQQVEMGKRFIVTKNGNTIAQICPAKPLAFNTAKKALSRAGKV